MSDSPIVRDGDSPIFREGASDPAESLASSRMKLRWRRSILVGLLGVLLISLLTPFNDYVLANTPLIGGAMPVGFVLYFLLVAVLINGPLSRWKPSLALSTPEMVVAASMVLVACALPGSGLMRFWPASLVGPWWHAQGNPNFARVFAALNLPDWFWPSGASQRQPVVTWFYTSMPPDGEGQCGSWLRAWIAPLVGWGVFFFGIYLAVLCLSLIVSHQWIHNERLPFPIARAQLAILEAPPPGQWLNQTLRSRGFLITVGVVVLLRGINAAHAHLPQYVPEIPLDYNFYPILADPPWSSIDGHVKFQHMSLLIIGLTYFVPMRISFSLWAMVLILQLPLLLLPGEAGVITGPSRQNVNFGSLVAFAGMILWTGRHHYGAVLRSMPRGRSPAGWGALLGAAIASTWLVLVGMSVLAAVLLVVGVLGTWLVMANVVAQSGLPNAFALSGPREWFVRWFPSTADVPNQFHVQTIGGMWAYASDQPAVYATTAMKSNAAVGSGVGWKLIAVMGLALLVGYVASTASTLWCYYHFPTTLDRKAESPINAEVLDGQPRWTMDHTLRTQQSGLVKPNDPSMWPPFLVGASLTGLLAYLQLHVQWWPLHPIGLLMVFSYSMRRIWFSIFLGWLAKWLVLRLGGSKLFQSATGVFLGLILGEAVAAGLWAVTSWTLALFGASYTAVQFLPASQF